MSASKIERGNERALTPEQLEEIKTRLQYSGVARDLAAKFGLSVGQILRLRTKHRDNSNTLA